MSLKALGIIILLACLLLSSIQVAAQSASQTAGEAQQTLYWSPVTLANPGSSFSLEDAQNVNYSQYDQFGAQNVHVSVITAQLYLNGVPYHMANVDITFSSDNDSVAVLEPNRTRPSDANGPAKILLIANNTVGEVNITARSMIYYGHELSDTCTVHVVGWGTVSGIVSDENKNGIPDATVTLWKWNGTANVEMLNASHNPQLSNDRPTIGFYTFVYVPVGSYNVTAEKEGHIYYRLFNMYQGLGTVTANVAIPDYAYNVPATATPTVAATVTPLPTEQSTAQPLPTPAIPVILAIGALFTAFLLKRKE